MAKKRILIVDDEKDVCDIIKSMLEKGGFETIIAHKGRDAFQKAKEGNPDLVLLDIVLPDIDGFTVCSEIKRSCPIERMPLIIFFTVLSLDIDIERGRKAGGDGFLIKPFSVADLLDYIRQKLQGKTQKPTTFHHEMHI